MASPMRLPRPHISLEVRCRVALRQLGEAFPNRAIDARRRASGGLAQYLSELLVALAHSLGCEVDDIRLDHQPALALRRKVFRSGTHVDYDPPSDSADDLSYLSHVDHLVKTNERGDHGQHPDRVLIKKMRRIERGPRPKRQPGFKTKAPKRRWPSRPFPSKGRKP